MIVLLSHLSSLDIVRLTVHVTSVVATRLQSGQQYIILLLIHGTCEVENIGRNDADVSISV